MGISDRVLDAYMASQITKQLATASPKYDPEEHNMASRKAYTNTPVLIIGAGISGMCAAIDMYDTDREPHYLDPC